MAALDGTLFDRVEHLQRWDDFTGTMHADLELAARQLADAPGNELGCAEEHFHRLGEARRHAPANGVRGGLGEGGRRQRGGTGSNGDGTAMGEKVTAAHKGLLCVKWLIESAFLGGRHS